MRKQRRGYALGAMIVGFSVASAVYAGMAEERLARSGQVSESPQESLQNSFHIDHYTEVAENGEARGENIYLHKCWICHNQYQRSAPRLTEFLQGDPLGDQALTAQVRDGSMGMPSFRTTLTDAEILDLVVYLRSGKCCAEGTELPVNPQYYASSRKWSVPAKLAGGPRGSVQFGGSPVEGVMVQLIAPNGVRTTVYSNEGGLYEFPEMQAGPYTLRIASPMEFRPYTRRSVQIAGSAKLEAIALERVSDAKGWLVATPEVESQLSGDELLWNLPGTAKEKDVFKRTCGEGCHSYQQIFRNRYDERSWRVLVTRMLHHGGGPLINSPAQPVDHKVVEEEDDVDVKWLTKVRGPQSNDEPLLPYPRPTGASTRAVVTEYELPRIFPTLHDVYGDSKGNIWYTSHLNGYVGKLDPRTGIITEYKIPITPGALPGTHHVVVDKNDVVFFSEGWAHKLAKFDPRTEKFTEVPIESRSPINSLGFGNFGLTPDDSIWITAGSEADKIDPQTGKVVQKYPYEGRGSYESIVSDDGNFWAGGAPLSPNENSAELLDIRTGEMLNVKSGIRPTAGRRGGFDPFGNAWFGGMNGTLVEIDAKAKRLREFRPPTPYSPYTDFYTCMPDKNGEVWAGEIHSKGFLRYNPRTDRWTEYEMPEPYAHTRGGMWIDNSTSPVTVWYDDYSLGRIIRIQPRE